MNEHTSLFSNELDTIIFFLAFASNLRSFSFSEVVFFYGYIYIYIWKSIFSFEKFSLPSEKWISGGDSKVKENLKKNWDNLGLLRECVHGKSLGLVQKSNYVNHLSKRRKRQRRKGSYILSASRCSWSRNGGRSIIHPAWITKIVSGIFTEGSRGRWLASRVDDTSSASRAGVAYRFNDVDQPPRRATAIGIYGRRRMEDAHPIKFVEHTRGTT